MYLQCVADDGLMRGIFDHMLRSKFSVVQLSAAQSVSAFCEQNIELGEEGEIMTLATPSFGKMSMKHFVLFGIPMNE